MSDDDDKLPAMRPVTAVEKRLLERAIEIYEGDPKEVLYQHTVLCQTYLPYRDPKEAREWTRSNGKVSLHVQAGVIHDPATGKFQQVGIPYGSKARLLLSHLNTRALRAGTRVVPIEEDSFTDFVKSMQDPLGDRSVAPNGREIRAYKDQLTRWSAASMILATAVSETRSKVTKPQIIETFEVTFQSAGGQRHLWPDTITLTEAYWNSLQHHAVPLDARALCALAHNALALDIYQWLAQRLHRLPQGQELVLPRVLLHRQFGQGYARERKFWGVFTDALRQVVTQYRTADVFVSEEGLHMRQSLPPVPRRLFAVPRRPGDAQAEN